MSTGKRDHQICKTNSVSFAYRAEITRSPLYGNKKGSKTDTKTSPAIFLKTRWAQASLLWRYGSHLIMQINLNFTATRLIPLPEEIEYFKNPRVNNFWRYLFIYLFNTRSRSLHGHNTFQQIISVDSASQTLKPSNEEVKCKIKHANNKFAVQYSCLTTTSIN